MIISHMYRYLFIEVPLTGSWAIGNELCQYYEGVPVLHKHACLPEFRKIATKDEQDYFVFATVRNPLDEVVSRYFKLMSNYKQVFSGPEAVEASLSDYSDLEKYNFVRETNASFSDYFIQYHQHTFSSIIDFSAPGLSYVIRFEHLQEDFAEVLRRLRIEQVRPIPVTNKTPRRNDEWQEYYTERLIPQAKRVFGPFMDRWGYQMPVSWGAIQVKKQDQLRYWFMRSLRYIYFIHFRYNQAKPAKVVRALRARLLS
jgi:hypothetical protein